MTENGENRRTSQYCEACKEYVPIEWLPGGTVLIHCPRCTGECLVCNCHLAEKCFSEGLRVKLLRPDTDNQGSGS
jgi:hypothetical protein